MLVSLSFCQGDETISGYLNSDAVWTLKSINGTDFDANATLTFPEEGKVAGKAPCNSYFGTQIVPYPWIEIENLAMTKMACSELPQETAFLSALTDMTIAEVLGDTLILTNDQGNEMVFQAD